jgi:hypothetical protein
MGIFTSTRVQAVAASVAAFGIICTAAVGWYRVWNDAEVIAAVRQEAHQQIDAARKESDENIKTMQVTQEKIVSDLIRRIEALQQKLAEAGAPSLQPAVFFRLPPHGSTSLAGMMFFRLAWRLLWLRILL